MTNGTEMPDPRIPVEINLGKVRETALTVLDETEEFSKAAALTTAANVLKLCVLVQDHAEQLAEANDSTRTIRRLQQSLDDRLNEILVLEARLKSFDGVRDLVLEAYGIIAPQNHGRYSIG